MASNEVNVNDSGRPGFEVNENIDAGYHVKMRSDGLVEKNDDDASTALGYSLTDGKSSGNSDQRIEELITVVPPRYGTTAQVVVNKADGSGVSDVAVGDELYYRSDGTLAKEADGTGGSGRTVSSEVAAIALEAQTSDDDALKEVFLMGGVS